jgi:hypothetical protein
MVEIERTVDLPATIEAPEVDGTIDVTADVTVVARPERRVHDDGRIVRTATAGISVCGTRYTTSLRRRRSRDGHPLWRSDLSDAGESHGPPAPVAEALGLETATPVLSITGDAARRLSDIDDGIEGALDDRRSRLQAEYGMLVAADERWVRGSGGMRAAHATGAVTLDDGRLPVLWRDGPDVGHQVWIRDDDVDLGGFEDSVVDAAIALAREESPLDRGSSL